MLFYKKWIDFNQKWNQSKKKLILFQYKMGFILGKNNYFQNKNDKNKVK